jgi:hypothetical protein
MKLKYNLNPLEFIRVLAHFHGRSGGILIFIYISCFLSLSTGCKKGLEIDPPVNSTNAGNIYLDDLTAASAITGIYTRISQLNYQTLELNINTALSSDELTVYVQTEQNLKFYQNQLSANLPSNLTAWKNTYPLIYLCTSAIEGLTASSMLTPAIKQQLLGECTFLRAYLYFTIVNLYGDVPLVVSTDYKVNASLPRTAVSGVYKQIEGDLLAAKLLLTDEYVTNKGNGSSVDRVRVNRSTANALLAKVYLYTKDYLNAERISTEVISKKAIYDTVSVTDVFKKNSKETIWAIQPITLFNTEDARLFIFPVTGPATNTQYYLSDYVVNSFDPIDKRRKNWLGSGTSGAKTYYYPFKYKVNLNNQGSLECTIAFRLAEQYLIRSEARAYLSQFNESIDDINVIRQRAGLPAATGSSLDPILKIIYKERVNELFTEGHRWLDLKRTGNVDAVMSMITPVKGGSWRTEWQWYPVPNTDRLLNDKLIQNLGYEQ